MTATSKSQLLEELARLRASVGALRQDLQGTSVAEPTAGSDYHGLPLGLLRFNASLECLDVNAFHAELVGQHETACLGAYADTLFPGADTAISQMLTQVLNDGEPRTAQWQREGKRPRTFQVDAALRGAVDAADRRVVVSVQEITALIEAQRATQTTEAQFRQIFDSVPECVKLLDGEGRLLDMNAAGLKLIEAEKLGEVQGESVYDLIAPEHRSAFVANVEAVSRGESNSQVFEVIGLRGTRRWMETEQVPMYQNSQAGEPPVVLAVTRDVSARKRAEESRDASERWFRSIFEQAGVAVGVVDSESGRLVRTNRRYEELLGYEQGALIGKTWVELTHPDDLMEDVGRMALLIEGHIRDYTLEKRLLHCDGSIRWVSLTVSPMWRPGEPATEHIVILQDVTERKRGDKLLQGLVEGTASSTGEEFFGPFAMAVAGILQSRYVLVCEHVDDPVTRVRTLAFWQQDHLGENVEYPVAGGPCEHTSSGEMTFIPHNVQQRFPEDEDLVTLQAESYCGIPLRSSSGQLIGHLAILDDGAMDFNICELPALQVFVSRAAAELERKRVEQALRESELRLMTVVRDAPVVITSVDGEGDVHLVDGRALEAVGFRAGEFVGRNYFRLWESQPQLTSAMRACLDGDEPDPTVTVVAGRQLETRYSSVRDVAGEVVGAITICVDVTERLQAEQELQALQERLAHVSRVSTMGEMATGLAHELNQPLAAMVSYSFAGEQLLERGNAEPTELRELFAKLTGQAARAGEIIRRLRSLVGKRVSQRSQMDVEQPLREVLELLDASIRKAEVDVDWDLGHDRGSAVEIDEIQIQQVLVNLIRNALDSMEHVPAAERTLRLQTRTVTPQQIEIAISDTGVGVCPEKGPQLFDAFYSTKPEGMGMGLAISRTIIEAHGGRLTFAAQEQDGATFLLRLPLVKVAS